MLRLGDIVPLNLQLYDGNDKARVLVKVLSPKQDIIFEGELVHIVNGLYETRQFLMPEVDYVMATYIVFDGKKESRDYERASDLFFRDKSFDLINEKLPSYEDFYTGRVMSEATDGFMEGKVIGTFKA